MSASTYTCKGSDLGKVYSVWVIEVSSTVESRRDVVKHRFRRKKLRDEANLKKNMMNQMSRIILVINTENRPNSSTKPGENSKHSLASGALFRVCVCLSVMSEFERCGSIPGRIQGSDFHPIAYSPGSIYPPIL